MSNTYTDLVKQTFYFPQEGFEVHDDNLFFKMKNGIRVGLLGGLVTTLSHDLDYDKSPSPGREHTDTTVSLTFSMENALEPTPSLCRTI